MHTDQTELATKSALPRFLRTTMCSKKKSVLLRQKLPTASLLQRSPANAPYDTTNGTTVLNSFPSLLPPHIYILMQNDTAI